MNKRRKPLKLAEAKIQAAILLKSLGTSDADKAVKRFSQLPEFNSLTTANLLQQKIKLKHALAVIAIENGFQSWLDLKIQINFIVGGYLNLWFAHYREAKSALKEKGGFLLPYKNQFFICSADYMKQIGFEPKDPDWEKIDYDWARPADQDAWQRLYKRWKKIKK
jgi:hypothetical protein